MPNRSIQTNEHEDFGAARNTRDNTSDFRKKLGSIFSRDNLGLSIRSISADTTLTYKDATVNVDTSSASVTVTLPYANSWGTYKTPIITIVKTDPANTLTVTANGSDTITYWQNGVEVTGDLTVEGSITLMSDGSTAWVLIAGSVVSTGNNRNIIIGGDFTTNPWQRGTSFTGVAAAFTADRWSYVASSDAVVNVTKTADAPTVAQAGIYTAHCLHLDVTTADASIGATQYAFFNQYVEGLNIAFAGFGQSGNRYLNLSFWVKATKTGIYSVSFRNSGDSRAYIAEYTVNASDTWEEKSIVIPVDTSGTWLYTNGIGLAVSFIIALGSSIATTAGSWVTGAYYGSSNQVNALDSVNNNFKLALIRLTYGRNKQPFEVLPQEKVLEQCQRYYEKSFNISIAPAQNTGSYVGPVHHLASGTNGNKNVFFKTKKRTTPATVTTYNPSAANANWRDLSAGADRVAAVVAVGETGFSIYSTSFVANNHNYIHWSADAEL